MAFPSEDGSPCSAQAVVHHFVAMDPLDNRLYFVVGKVASVRENIRRYSMHPSHPLRIHTPRASWTVHGLKFPLRLAYATTFNGCHRAYVFFSWSNPQGRILISDSFNTCFATTNCSSSGDTLIVSLALLALGAFIND